MTTQEDSPTQLHSAPAGDDGEKGPPVAEEGAPRKKHPAGLEQLVVWKICAKRISWNLNIRNLPSEQIDLQAQHPECLNTEPESTEQKQLHESEAWWRKRTLRQGWRTPTPSA